MGKVVEATSANFESLISSSETVLVDFWAPWCGPCRMQAPILETIAGDSGITATIAKLNTDENTDIAQRFGINSIPTLILFRNGSEAERFVGVQPEASLRKKLAGA
jgi:thioredoxin 1